MTQGVDPSRASGAVPASPRATTRSPQLSDTRVAGEGSGATPGVPLLDARLAEAEREEHLRDVIQTRRAIGLGIFLWFGYLLLDAAMSRWLDGPPFRFFVLARAVAAVFFFVAWGRMHVKPLPGPRLLTALDVAVYSVASSTVAVLCVSFGGLESPYCMGASICLVGATISRFYPWRTGLWRFGLSAMSFVAVMLGSAAFSPLVRAQLGSSRSLAIFGMYLSFLATTWAMSTVGGHIVWSLRRQVFESRSVGRYRLKRRLGAGGMGEVWLAHHAVMRRDVAVKILLRPGRIVDAASLARFEREVRATGELTHPNTVRVFDYGTTEDGLWFYAMEYIEGEDLARLVAREGPIAPRRAVHLLSQAARALGEAHERRIVHRDVKPENVLVTRVGGDADFVKVVDFGIAKVPREDEGDVTLTQTGVVLGTPAYMSPEAVAGRRMDARSDVYGLGAVLYFLLTGGPPFDESNLGAVLHAHLHVAPAPLAGKVRHPVSNELDAVVQRALAKSPEERFPNATALSLALAACPEAHAPVMDEPSAAAG